MSERLPKSARDVLAKQTAGEAHLSPDLLNAYVEHSLSDEESSTVLAHLAECGECREIIFLASGVTEEELLATAKQEHARMLVRTHADALSARQLAAAAPPVRQPEGCAVLEPRPRTPRRWWKWAVPALAAVIAVGIGILQHDKLREMTASRAPQQMARVEQPTVTLSQPNPSESSATSNQPSAPPAGSESRTYQLQDRSKVDINENAIKLPPAQKKELAEQDRDMKQRQDELQRREQAQLASNLAVSKDKRDMVAMTAPGPAMKAAPSGEPKPAPPPPPAAQSTTEATSAAPLLQADNAETDALKGQSLAKSAMPSNSAAGMVGALETQHAAPTRWRISSDGHVEHTVGPSTWERVMSAEPVTFRVVAIVGRNVWAGGSDGALFRSPDGGHEWNRVGLAGEQGTIKTIRFSTAQKGSVTTEAGTVWKTTDGGVTWSKQ
jgi:photosynthesis system II assembly factor YCF48-like protein/putative zinc finger protein